MLLTFEENDVLDNITASGAVVSLSGSHYKDGEKSLQCEFDAGGAIRLQLPIGYRHAPHDGKDSRVPTFGVYLYQEAKTEGLLEFKFLTGEKQCVRFTVLLGFTGWRSVFVKFDSDMEGSPEEAMDGLEMTASQPCTVFMDQMITCNLVDPRSPETSFQVPFVKRGSKAGGHAYSFYELYRRIPAAAGEASVPKAIRERYLEYLETNYRGWDLEKSELLKYVKSLSIQRKEGGITGRPVEYVNQAEILAGLDYPVDYAPERLRKYNEMLFRIAFSWYHTGDGELAEAYLLMLRHLIDQGLAAGSSMGVLHHIDYSMRMFYPAALLMEQEIRQAGLMDEVIGLIGWFSKFGMVFVRDVRADIVTADVFNTHSQAFLIVCLLADSQEYLSALKKWMDFAMRPTTGLMGLFKPDGSVYHHCGHYTAYGMDGLTGIVPVVYALSGTKYRLSERAWRLLSKVMGSMRFYCNRLDYPISMSGRHPTGLWRLDTAPFLWWARAGLDRGDTGPASIYLRLVEGEREPAVQPIRDTGISAEQEPQGHLTMNRACAAFHRFENHLVSVKGFSKYLWGNETYQKDNLYGRFMSYGQLEIITNSQKESGFSQNGFDWARLPGTTAIHFPIEEMKARVYNLDEFSGFEEMLLSDEPFAGGVDDGSDGVFAMKLHGHPKYDGSHRAAVSYFFVGGFVLCLGTGITNEEKRWPTNTTLFQKVWDGAPLEQNGYLTDGYGNRYYCKEQIRLECGRQKSQDQSGAGATEGMFATAYLDHGIAPKNACYEFGVGVAGAEKPDYEILQADAAAHVVRFGHKIFYAIFHPEGYRPCGLIEQVDNMLLAVVDEETKELSVCQPDLGLYDDDPTQYDAEGNRVEVSIYSRSWLYQLVKNHRVRIVSGGIGHSYCLEGGEVRHDAL